MHSFTRFVRRLGGAVLLLSGALVPAVTHAQGAAATKPDSVAKKDSAATHTAPGKRSRIGALGRAAAGKANDAANKVEQTTGVSKETMAKAALAGTGVGAAAMLARPDSGSPTASVAASAGRSVFQKLKDARAGHAGAAPAASPADAGAMPGGGGMTAEQMALYRQQMAQAQASAMQANAMPGGGSGEMQRLQAEYTQIAMRASAGDKEAARQMMRFSQEWADAITRLQALGPAGQQQSAYEAAMRDALSCATKGHPCRTKAM